MSRTNRGSKSLGYDYWSKRPCSKSGYGRHIKDMTNSVERAKEREMLLNIVQDEFYLDDNFEDIDILLGE